MLSKLGSYLAVLTVLQGAALAEGAPDPKASCPLSLTSAGAIIIKSPRSNVWVPPGATIYLAPLSAMPAFKPADIYLNVDGQGQEEDDQTRKPMPLIPIAGWPEGQRPVRARRSATVTLADNAGHLIEAMQCAVENRDPGIRTGVKNAWRDERLKLQIASRGSLGSIYLFSESGYIGAFSDPSDTISIDCRRMASGPHTIWAVPEAADHVILAPIRMEVEIAPRYTVTVDPLSYTVPVEAADVQMKLKVVRSDGVTAKLARVRVAGNRAGQSDKAGFDLSVSLKDVPSGQQLVEVFGIGADNVRYAPEVVRIQVENRYWFSQIAETSEYRTIQANREKIATLEKDARYWYTMAWNEPQFRETNQITSSESFATASGVTIRNTFSTFRTPGRSGEYYAKGDRDLTEMAQLYLEDGHLYQRLKMPAGARSSYVLAMRTASENSRTYSLANSEIDKMDAAQDEGD